MLGRSDRRLSVERDPNELKKNYGWRHFPSLRQFFLPSPAPRGALAEQGASPNTEVLLVS